MTLQVEGKTESKNGMQQREIQWAASPHLHCKTHHRQEALQLHLQMDRFPPPKMMPLMPCRDFLYSIYEACHIGVFLLALVLNINKHNPSKYWFNLKLSGSPISSKKEDARHHMK